FQFMFHLSPVQLPVSSCEELNVHKKLLIASIHRLQALQGLRSFPTRRSSDLRLSRGQFGHTEPEGFRGPDRGVATTCDSSVRSSSEEHTAELQSLRQLVCRLLLEKNNRVYCCLHCLLYSSRQYSNGLSHHVIG